MVANTPLVWNGTFKEVYSKLLDRLIPEAMILSRDIQFVSQEEREGNKYHQPVVTSREAGWTLSAAGGETFTLNAAEPARTLDAQVNGIEFVLRAAISYGAVSRALKQKEGSARNRAFVNATSFVVENMMETAAFVREMELLYGGGSAGAEGWGTILSQTDDSGTTQTWRINSAYWADAIFAGQENSYWDVYSSNWGTKRNAAGTLQLTGVDLDNMDLTFVGTEAEMDAFQAGDFVLPRGAFSNEMDSVFKMLTTTTGNLWNIPVTQSLWKSSTSDAGLGALAFSKVTRALIKPVSRGLMAPVNSYVPIASWNDMMNDLSALRRYAEKSGGKLEQGASELQFHNVNGSITIKPHILLKRSHCFNLATKYHVRVGSSDITFSLPGGNENFMTQLANQAGWELRNYFNLNHFCRRPYTASLINNITPTA